MVEIHGWMTLRETYKVTDEENFDRVLKQVNEEIGKLKFFKPPIKSMNGECFIEFSSYTNHMSNDVKEMLFFFEIVSKIAKGSYGLLYIYNDEDANYYNNFVVYKLARGKVEMYKDRLLSPVIPTIEDVDSDLL